MINPEKSMGRRIIIKTDKEKEKKKKKNFDKEKILKAARGK